jgi:hypothetical protein
LFKGENVVDRLLASAEYNNSFGDDAVQGVVHDAFKGQMYDEYLLSGWMRRILRVPVPLII